MNIVILGLENSVTKLVAQTVATGLGITDEYDGHYSISNDYHKVQHYSYPYGENVDKRNRDNYPHINVDEWDYIVICTRDWHCSLHSKISSHQPNKQLAIKEHTKGKELLSELVSRCGNKLIVFSYESWFILGNAYFSRILMSMNIDAEIPECNDINKRHIK